MCKVSAQMKLCACGGTNAYDLPDYWVLSRRTPGKDLLIVGRIALPDRIDRKTQQLNRTLLLTRLHEPDAFDIDIQLQDGDALSLVFSCIGPEGDERTAKQLQYQFKRASARWVEHAFGPFELSAKYDALATGTLQPALDDIDDRCPRKRASFPRATVVRMEPSR